MSHTPNAQYRLSKRSCLFVAALSLAAALFSFQGCTTIETPYAAPPTFNPPSGTFSAPISVAIADASVSATIHYTTDGSTPTSSSPIYTAPIPVSTTCIIRAIATISGYPASSVSSAIYTIAIPKTATPTFTPATGAYITAQSVGISDATPNATIYFTNDGSIPTTSSAHFTTAITVSTNEVINVIALAPGYLTSDLATATYYIGVQHGNWTWMGGGPNMPGNYGTLGVPDSTNIPIPRQGAISWTDNNGNFWLFGGELAFPSGPYMNDFWEYTPTTNQWTWQGGSQTPGAVSVHGPAGLADASNFPGARSYAFTWTDANGNLWLFGGEYDSLVTGLGYYLNDLWKFDPSTKLWTWFSGNPVEFPPAVYGTKGVPSPTNIPGGRNIGVSWTDTNDNLWLFGGGGIDAALNSGGLNDLWKYTPSLNEWTWVSGSNFANPGQGVYGTQGIATPSNTPGGLGQETAFVDQHDRVWIFGGSGLNSAGAGDFLNTLWELDLTTGEWTWVDGGTTGIQTGNFGTKGVPSALNIPPGRMAAYGWIDTNNNDWVFGGNKDNGSIGDFGNDLWQFNPTTNEWTWMSGSAQQGASTSYGLLGIPDPANVPGAREAGITWVDKSGVLWLFGGVVKDSSNSWLLTNELWRYQP